MTLIRTYRLFKQHRGDFIFAVEVGEKSVIILE